MRGTLLARRRRHYECPGQRVPSGDGGIGRDTAVRVRAGNSSTANVKFDAGRWLISSASVLEMTNAGFVSPLAAEVPCEGARTQFVGGWDTGSEANVELRSQGPALCPSLALSG